MFKSVNYKVSFGALVLSIIITLILIPSKNASFDSLINYILPLIVLANVILHFFVHRKLYNNWLRYDTLFLLGFLIVHFQIPFLASVGIEPQRPDFIWINKLVVNYATWFSALAILIWLLGFHLYGMKKKIPIVKIQKQYTIKHPFIAFLLICSFLLFFFLVGSDFLGGSYAGTDNWGVGATHVFLILRITLYLSVIYFFINNSRNLKNGNALIKVILSNWSLFVIIALYSLIFLAAGDRGPIMQLGIVFLSAYSLFYKRLTFSSLIVLIYLGSLFFAIIRYGRTRDANYRENNIITEGFTSYREYDNPLIPTEELASSVRILYRALDVVPDVHPYLNGVSVGANIIDVIPFGGTIFLKNTLIPYNYLNSSTFFTVLGQGQFYQYGEGSEIIADLYINFGFWLTLLIFLFFGYFISYLTFSSTYIRNHKIVIIYLILAISAIYVNRSNFLHPLKLIIWTLAFDYLFTKRIISK